MFRLIPAIQMSCCRSWFQYTDPNSGYCFLMFTQTNLVFCAAMTNMFYMPTIHAISIMFPMISTIQLTLFVNRRLELIVEQCKYDKVCVYPSKSQFMVVSNRILVSQLVLQLHGCDLHQKGSFKYPSIYIDRTVKFHTQIYLMNIKLSSLCEITYRLKN